MIDNSNDIGFVQDIAGLDKLRQSAVSSDDVDKKEALKAAAKQFESIFTTMLFKSMRDANASFESDLMKSQNQDFYRQMKDEQMASELSSTGSLGLADMIVAQLSAGINADDSELVMRNAALDTSLRLPVEPSKAGEVADEALSVMAVNKVESKSRFDDPKQFVESMMPYANKAAKVLGVDPTVLIAQAALETGWGKKVIRNSLGSSNNLFNIKADRSWKGDKIASQTLEFHDDVPVKQNAVFRSYDSYEDSFNDFVRFLNQNPRYETTLSQNNNAESFIRGIHRAGYATDPNYSEKVLQVKQRIDSM